MVTNPPQIKKVKFPTDYLETLSAKVSLKINKTMKVGLESSRLGTISHNGC